MKFLNFLFILHIFLFCGTRIFAQVTIGSLEEPEYGAMLQLKEKTGITDDASNASKGLEMPRVCLSDLSNLFPMFLVDPNNPVSGSNTEYLNHKTELDKKHTGLVVYNVNETTPFEKGLYYWNGTEWKRIEFYSDIEPHFTNLICNGAILSPEAYYAGISYTGILKIPYNGGNGKRYPGGNPVTANGLTFQLQDGKLEAGSGEFVFAVSGIPILSSPNPTIFTVDNTIIPTFSGSCEIKIGDQLNADIKTVAIIAPLSYTTEGRAGYAAKITTPNGKFSIRVFTISGNSFSSSNLQIRSNTTDVIITSNEHWLWGSSGGNQQNQLKIFAGEWCGDGGNSTAVTNATIQGASNTVSWGNASVYQSSMPENRIYAFTTTDPNDKVFYSLRFMMSTSIPSSDANTTNCPNGVCESTKIFLLIEQITAP